MIKPSEISRAQDRIDELVVIHLLRMNIVAIPVVSVADKKNQKSRLVSKSLAINNNIIALQLFQGFEKKRKNLPRTSLKYLFRGESSSNKFKASNPINTAAT